MRRSDLISTELLRAMQARAARAAIGASSMRGGSSKGVVEAGRSFLCQLSLKSFGTPQRGRFLSALDSATDELRVALPRGERHWGLARKGLNIFLRECLYTVYLRDAYALDRAEEFFEVPLDSITGEALHQASAGTLPRWQTVRGMTPVLSELYQAVAASIGAQRGIAPVHLDAVWWGVRGEG